MSKKENVIPPSTHTQAANADKHYLYELSVQCSESEIDFVDTTYHKLRKHKAKLLREDFCGTANVCCEWVKRGNQRQAIGIDLDADVLAWGNTHNLSKLTVKQQQRIQLINENVLTAKTKSPDIVSAMNFSYWLFKERSALLAYFKSVHQTLATDGIFFLDAYGGYDSHRESEESREIEDKNGNFTYVWDQYAFNPVDHNVKCAIHFKFPDGSILNKAFQYDWRLYTLPEVQDLLKEAGFSNITVYWQNWDENDEPDGDFVPATQGEADAGWICYLSACK